MAEAALCTVDDVLSIFGKVNVYKWADLDSDQNEKAIRERILAKIALSTEEFYNRVRSGPHAVPFDPIPLCVGEVTAKMVGVRLYEGRGITDFIPVSPEQMAPSPVATHKKDADLWIRNYLANRIHLDLPLVSTQIPVVIDDAENCPDECCPRPEDYF